MKFGNTDWSARKFFSVTLLVTALGAFAATGVHDLLDHSDEPVPCWPDVPCAVTTGGGAGPLAYDVLQAIRVQAWNDFNATPPRINKVTFIRVADALVHCTADIKAYPGGNAPHCSWLKTVWNKAIVANTDAQWNAVATDLESGH